MDRVLGNVIWAWENDVENVESLKEDLNEVLRNSPFFNVWYGITEERARSRRPLAAVALVAPVALHF